MNFRAIILTLFVVFCISGAFAEETPEETQKKLDSYENNIYITYQILLGLFLLTILITGISIAQHYSVKNLMKYLLFVLVGFAVLVSLRMYG